MLNKRLRSLIRIFTPVFVLSWIIGCGYAFAPQGEHIDKNIRQVYVEPFGNQTAQADLENMMRSAFIDEFIQSSRFKVTHDADQADAVLSGTILNLHTTTLSYRKNILAAEERATIVLQASFIEKATGKTIWSSRQIRGTIDYELEDDINALPGTRRIAYEKLAADTAESAFNMMMSNF